MAARVKKGTAPPVEPFVVEAIAKMVLGVILILVFTATFMGISILYEPVSTIDEMLLNFGQTGAALIVGLATLSVGIIAGAILHSVKRL